MSPPTITFRRAREAGACQTSYREMAAALGGVSTWGERTPIPITRVLDVLGVPDALWALGVLGGARGRRILCDFAADAAERVLPVWEAAHPGDRRPHEAIRIARLCARGLVSAAAAAADAAADAAAYAAAVTAAHAAAAEVAVAAAEVAAYAAAVTAAHAAAAEVAVAAAEVAVAAAADAAWQVEHLRELLEAA